MALRVITFDLDNTLRDVEPALLRAEDAQRRWLLEHRPGTLETLDHEALWRRKKEIWKLHPELAHNVSALRRVLLRTLQEDAGYDPETARLGAAEAFAVFLAERQKVELYSEALEVLQRLSQHYRLGALTNGNADVYKTDAGEYFDFAFLAEDFSARKPAPPMFEAALQRTGVRASEIAHVGDNPEHDVLGALRAGMRAIWLNVGGHPWPGDAEGAQHLTPDATIDSLGGLPAAVAALHHP